MYLTPGRSAPDSVTSVTVAFLAGVRPDSRITVLGRQLTAIGGHTRAGSALLAVTIPHTARVRALEQTDRALTV